MQALRNWADVEEYKRAVYPHPDWISALATSTPIAAHVRVDYELWGCPVDKDQLLAVLRALLSGTEPRPAHPPGLPDLQAARPHLCRGRARHALPGAGDAHRLRRDLPAHGARLLRLLRTRRPAQPAGFTALLAAQGLSRDEAVRRLRGITGWAPAFRRAGDALAADDRRHVQ